MTRFFLILSLICNLVLAYFLFTLPKDKSKTEMAVKGNSSSKIQLVTREEVLAELRTHFPIEKQISNFEQIIENHPILNQLLKYNEDKILLDKISEYIFFVNTYIFNVQPTGDKK